MNLGLTLIREAFNFWTPTYLNEVAKLSPADAAKGSLVFPLVGAASALGAGLLSDRLRGRHGRVIIPSLVLLLAALGLFRVIDARGQPLPALLLLGLVAFFMMPAYSFCTGVIALDLGGKRAASTAAGLIDTAGYLGAVFSGYGFGRMVQAYGWEAGILGLAVAAGLTLVAAVLYSALQELHPGRRRLPPVQEEIRP
jgi:OPA family glycerol-3-phosphate transporter-like MFS transporter